MIHYIKKPEIFSFDEIKWFLDRNYDECLYKVQANDISRIVAWNDQHFIMSVREKNDQLEVVIHESDSPAAGMPEAYMDRWFDIKRDLKPFYNMLKQSKLGYMAENYFGLRLVGIPDLFEALCWCIIGQQINLNFAYRIKRRFVEAYGYNHQYNGSVLWAFPRPEDLTSLTITQLRDIQFSRQKAEYILLLAEAFRLGDINYTQLNRCSIEERKRELMKLKGVGEWTAHYVLMKTFGEVDKVPYGDIGLFKALENHGIITDRRDSEKVKNYFAQFPGWGGYLTLYLWRSLTSSGS